jgi:hypothetical protein
MTNFFLAFLVGIVVRWIAGLGVLHFLRTYNTKEELLKRPWFHISAVFYRIGTWTACGGFVLTLASLVKKYIF